MKIVFSTQGKDWDAKIDPRFGRAAGFLLFDKETGSLHWHSNEQNINAPHGAGIQAGQNVAKLGADVVITGHVGPKAFSTLNNAKIKIFTTEANITIKEAYERFKQGKLSEMKTAL